MELKDYLHLYLGCNIQLQDGTIDTLKCIDSVIEYVNFGYGNAKEIHTVKPILRPLSDMNAKDWANVALMTDEGGEEEVLSATGQMAKYLLSQHFDLFGLIDAGLAIEKTK